MDSLAFPPAGLAPESSSLSSSLPHDRTSPSRVRLIDLEPRVRLEQVLALSTTGAIIACDFAIQGAATWEATPWGFVSGRVTNLDHHAAMPTMQRQVSSTNLALTRVQAHGVVPASSSIVINHTDCDSVLSSAIVAGELEPWGEFGVAAIAADHTGEANAIADLLQALDAKRDLELSLRSLRALLAGEALEAVAQEALFTRLRKRELAAQMVASSTFVERDGVFYADLPKAIDGELVSALLPGARVVVLFSPHPTDSASRLVKMRLGLAALEGISLHALDIQAFDPAYGGRWNAGSNKRGGGTRLSPDEYARHLAQALEALRV